MSTGSPHYWVRRVASGSGHKVWGPLSGQKVMQLAKSGQLRVTDEVAASPEGPWRRAELVRGLNVKASVPLVPAPTSGASPPPSTSLRQGSSEQDPALQSKPHAPSASANIRGRVATPPNGPNPPASTRYPAMDCPIDGPRPVCIDIEAEYYVLAARLAQGKLSAERSRELNARLMRMGMEGFAQASFDVAAGFDTGLAGEKDPAKAWEWFLRAAQQGHPASRRVVAKAVLDGIGPIPMGRQRAPGVVGLGSGCFIAGRLDEAPEGCLPIGAFAGPPTDLAARKLGDSDPLGVLMRFAVKDSLHLSLTMAVVVALGDEGSPTEIEFRAALGILTIGVREADFRRLSDIASRDADSFDLWLDPISAPVSDGARVVVRYESSDGIGPPIPGLVVLHVDHVETLPDRRTRSGTRTETRRLDLRDTYERGLAVRRQDAESRCATRRGMDADPHVGWMPIASRFAHEDVVKALGPSALNVDYKSLDNSNPMRMALVRAQGVAERPYVERVFWMHVAWQFQPQWTAQWVGRTGFGLIESGLDDDELRKLKMEEWIVSKQDATQAIELAQQWVARFWPALATRPLPMWAMRAMTAQADAMASRNIPLPGAESDLARLRKSVSAEVLGPQPPGITLLKHKAALGSGSHHPVARIASFIPSIILPVPIVVILALVTSGVSLPFTYRALDWGGRRT